MSDNFPNNQTLLSSVPFFSELDEEDIDWFLKRARLVEYPKKSFLFQRGDPAEFMYLIKEGWVRLFHTNREGEETVQAILTRGDTFGEECAFEEYDYPYNAQVVGSKAHCLVVPGSIVRERLEAKPKVALKMLTAFSHHLNQTGLMYDLFTKLTASQRVAAFILKLSMDRGYAKTVKFPYNKLLVASRLCMQPETFSRALKRLGEDIGITMKGREIIIDDIEELQDYCEIYCCKDTECSLQEKLTCSNRHCDLFRFLKLM